MKEIRTFEEAIKQNARSLKDLGINGTLFWAYRTSKENGNELIDFNEVIWDYDIEEIAQTLKSQSAPPSQVSSKPSQPSRSTESAWQALPQSRHATPIGRPAITPLSLQSR